MYNPNQGCGDSGLQTKALRRARLALFYKRKGAPSILVEVYFLRLANSLCPDVMLTKQMFD